MVSLASSSIHQEEQDFPGCQVSCPHLWVKVERAGTSGQEGSAGGRCWDLGFLGMCVCVCVYLCVCTFPDTMLGPKYLWGLCVAVTVLHHVFNWVLPGFPHPSPMQDKLSYKYVSYLTEQMNSCMIFQAHVAASASEVSVVKEKLVFFAAVLSSFPLNRPNKCNGHQMLHRNVIDDCGKNTKFFFLCRNFMVPESPLAVFFP